MPTQPNKRRSIRSPGAGCQSRLTERRRGIHPPIPDPGISAISPSASTSAEPDDHSRHRITRPPPHLAACAPHLAANP